MGLIEKAGRHIGTSTVDTRNPLCDRIDKSPKWDRLSANTVDLFMKENKSEYIYKGPVTIYSKRL